MHYMILGNGVAGIEAALTLRRRLDPTSAQITVISRESDFFFSRTALMYAFMDRMTRRELEPYERDVYATQQITLLRDTVIDLDAHARSLTTRERGILTYDRLLLATGAGPRPLNTPGLKDAQEGAVHFVSLQDLDACERLTPSTTQAVVVGGGLIGIELVESLLYHGVHTTFLIREPHYWPAALSPQESTIVEDHMRAHGVHLRLGEELQRVLIGPDHRVRGVLTSQDQELPCQLLGICIGVTPHTDWLQSATSPPRLDRGICVDRAFKTSLPDVWAAGDCARITMGPDAPSLHETIWYSAKRQGQLAALAMLGDRVSYTPPLFFNSSKFMDIELTTVGQAHPAPPGAHTLWRTSPTHPHLTQRILFAPEEQRRVLGFNMLGSRWNHRILTRWILERRDVEFVTQNLRHAQFDVEFGRAPLDAMHQEELAPS